MKKLDEITEVWSMEKLISSYDKILKGEVAGGDGNEPGGYRDSIFWGF